MSHLENAPGQRPATSLELREQCIRMYNRRLLCVCRPIPLPPGFRCAACGRLRYPSPPATGLATSYQKIRNQASLLRIFCYLLAEEEDPLDPNNNPLIIKYFTS